MDQDGAQPQGRRHVGGPHAPGLAPRRAKADALRFLDSLGIAHDEDGTVENLPESPPKEKLRATIDQLLINYPAEAVAVYLHAFHDMDSTVSWPPLGEVLAEDERLKLGSQPT